MDIYFVFYWVKILIQMTTTNRQRFVDNCTTHIFSFSFILTAFCFFIVRCLIYLIKKTIIVQLDDMIFCIYGCRSCIFSRTTIRELFLNIKKKILSRVLILILIAIYKLFYTSAERSVFARGLQVSLSLSIHIPSLSLSYIIYEVQKY